MILERDCVASQIAGSVADAPATTSPVLAPIRTWIVTAQFRSSSLFRPRAPRAYVRRSSCRSERVILMQPRDGEDRHHRITAVLFDGAAVALDRGSNRLEVAGLDVAEQLGVQDPGRSNR
jgi:hypothetical protein